jgi:hypothetical protein
LISCSQLISDLNGFANRVEAVADEITGKAAIYREQEVEIKGREDVLGVLERLGRRGEWL